MTEKFMMKEFQGLSCFVAQVYLWKSTYHSKEVYIRAVTKGISVLLLSFTHEKEFTHDREK
jgi:hypothetical protein